MNNAKLSAGMLVILTVALAVGYGCATAPPAEPVSIYPAYPEEPRIAYIRSHRGTPDFKKRNIFDMIFGVSGSSSDILKPYGVFAKDDKIYVTDTQIPLLLVVDKKTQNVSAIGFKGSRRLSLPIGVAATTDGVIYVSDSKQKRIFVYDAEGNIKFVIGDNNDFKNPTGLAIDEALGRLYVADSYAHKVHVLSLKGEPMLQIGKPGMGGDGNLYYPTNVAIDRRNGNVCVSDSQNFRVQVFDKEGKFIRKFGELGDAPGTFSRPKGIGVDTEGHIYVVDAAFNNFQIFDETGQLLMFVGGAGSRPGTFQIPAGMYIDESDKIYVVDSLNQRVQVFQYLSEKWKKENPEEYKKYLMPPVKEGKQ